MRDSTHGSAGFWQGPHYPCPKIPAFPKNALQEPGIQKKGIEGFRVVRAVQDIGTKKPACGQKTKFQSSGAFMVRKNSL
jgi:hypothetical protein